MSSAKQGFWGALFGAPPSKVMKVAMPAAGPPVVSRDNRSLLQKRGWTDHGNKRFTGFYATSLGSYAGEITYRHGEWLVVIYKPPMELIEKHPKRVCFHHHAGNSWTVHLHQEPCDGDASAILAYVERIIEESKSLAGR